MKHARADILGQYGPFDDVEAVHGVSYDGTRVWFASGGHLNGLDPESGDIVARLATLADAGTAFDGQHLWQIAGSDIRKIDPATGDVLGTIPGPEGSNSGLAWAEGSLWVGDYEGRRIREIDPGTGAIRRVIASDRFVTGVTWVEGELWHGTWEGAESDLRRIDPVSGTVLERLDMPEGTGVSGLESDGHDRFFCGSGGGATVRTVRRPERT